MSQTTILLLIVILLSISSITILLLTRLHLRKITERSFGLKTGYSEIKQATRRGGYNRGSRYTGESDTTEA